MVTSKNLKENGLDLTDVSFISMEDYLEINKRSKVNYGDILLGLIGTIGNPVLVDSVGFAIKNVGLIKNSENFYKYFLIQILKSSIFENYVSQKNTGNTQKFLGLDTLRNFQFLCPSKEEQTQIGNFFKQLDDTIALHQREFEKFKILRKAYLKHIFIDDTTQFRAEKTIPWEQRKLGEIVDVFDGTHQTPKYTDKGIMFLSVEDIKTLKSEKYISEEDFKKEFKYFPEIGDVLMTRIGDVGTTNVICSTQPIAYYVSLALLKNKNSDPYFLSTVISSGSVQSDIWKRTLHIAFPKKINKSEIEKVIIPLPSYVEQTQIGNFFKQLDDTIALHQRTLEKYQKLKISYLEKMFPKGNELYPELRFPNFTDAWEQCKLGDVVNIIMGQSPDSKNYTNNSSDHILVQGNADIKNGFVYPRVWTTQITKQGHSGDLIMSVRAPVGDIAKTEYDVVLGRGVCAIKGNEFIFQLLTKMKENDYWESLSTGSTFDSINSNDIKNAEIFIPSLEEQTQIGNFFKQLDDTIALHQKELAKYQQIKTACLEKMFVE